MLLHCISLAGVASELPDESVPEPKEAYKIIRKELEEYNPELAKKAEAILLTKTDLVDAKILKKYLDYFKKTHEHVLAVTIVDDESVKKVSDDLVKILRKI